MDNTNKLKINKIKRESNQEKEKSWSEEKLFKRSEYMIGPWWQEEETSRDRLESPLSQIHPETSLNGKAAGNLKMQNDGRV